jgi:DNA-binding Lrp family transcriptional regulator
METSLDELDFEILKNLKVNSRASNRNIAKTHSICTYYNRTYKKDGD